MPAEPHHFSEYGFDPQLDQFQMLEEARNQQRETLSRFIDDISNDKKKKKMKRRWWWNKAFTTFLKWTTKPHLKRDEDRDVHMARARAFRSNFSGPLYMADSSRPTPPHHRSQPDMFGGLLSPGGGGTGSGCSSPYLSLRELNMERQNLQRMSASASPIYLVT
ncbi:unnamed protein product [Rhodiola kirilowii]